MRTTFFFLSEYLFDSFFKLEQNVCMFLFFKLSSWLIFCHRSNKTAYAYTCKSYHPKHLLFFSIFIYIYICSWQILFLLFSFKSKVFFFKYFIKICRQWSLPLFCHIALSRFHFFIQYFSSSSPSLSMFYVLDFLVLV